MSLVVVLTAVLWTVVTPSSGSLTWTYDQQWTGGFKIAFTLTPTVARTSWSLRMTLSGSIDSVQASWMANTQILDPPSNTIYRLTNLASNGNISPSSPLANVFVVHCGTTCASNNYVFELLDEADTTSGTATTTAQTTTTCTGQVSWTLTENWGSGFKGNMKVTAGSAGISSWSVLLTLDQGISSIEASWFANYARTQTNQFRLTNKTDTGVIASGQSLERVVVVHCQSSCDPSTLTLTLESCGESSGAATTTVAPSTGSSQGTKNYTDALSKAVLFYYAQRSGDLTNTNKPIPWVVSSALTDNPVGGWYDAGDYVKFNFPMAWSAMTLLWSMQHYETAYANVGLLTTAEDSVKWALDYLLRCWDNTAQQLVVQVGDGVADHNVWDRPQNMATPRPTFKVNASHPGSDVAGSTASALALGYLAFKDKDLTFANNLKTAAEQIYTFATSNTGLYSTSVPAAAMFYNSNSFQDDLCVASMFLYKATGSVTYLNKAKNDYYNAGTPWSYSVDESLLACQILLYEETQEQQYKTVVEQFFQQWFRGYNPSHTACGLVYRHQWGSNRHATNVAFTALVASDLGITTVSGKQMTQFAVEQINYILGDNPLKSGGTCFSYLIGYGSRFPVQPHHRAASCPVDTSQSCLGPDDSGPNPNEMTGAMVGGPDSNDQYVDSRDDHVQNEVACDYNAGLQGALAGIINLSITNNMPVTDNKCKC